MRLWIAVAIIAAFTSLTFAEPKLGINLAGPADWNTELPFVNVFRMSRPWISQKKGAAWGKGPALDVDAHGWVKRLEPACFAETPLCNIKGGHYPSGRYTVLYEGQGTLAFDGKVKVISEGPGRIEVDVDSSGRFFLRITQTDPANYIRNIRVIMPGFEKTHTDNPFHPAFLARWRGMTCIRFMDWMHTNHSKISRWSDRPTLEDATWSKMGVPVEAMVDLCNRLGADPWFCMPHLADDDYVRQFAQMVKDRLDGKRKIYIEYSNEVWNGSFAQCRFAQQKGMQLKLADKPWPAGQAWTAKRSLEIFAIWEQVFGGHDRFVRVLPTQAANIAVSRQVITGNDAYKHADALAIAPYISLRAKQGETVKITAAGLDALMQRVADECLPAAVEKMRKQKAIADEFGLDLICYEAGQHLVGVGPAKNDDRLTALYQQANADPRMADCYRRYYDAWAQTGGGVMAVFDSVGQWTKHGSWGLMQYYDDQPMRQPKMRATLEQARAWGQKVTIAE